MHHYTQGKPTTQGHKGIPDGFYEEEQGQGGFYGPVSHLLKRKPSTRWVDIQGPLRPRMFDLVELARTEKLVRLFHNPHLCVYNYWIKCDNRGDWKASRNADGDTVYFCHKGKGEVLTEYGLLKFDPGCYVVIPKCVTHTIFPEEDSQFFVIESRTSHYREPDRGMVGRHAFYDINAIGKPNLEEQEAWIKQKGADVKRVEIKHDDEITTYTYGDQVYDVIGWKGDLFPFTLHMNDMMPLMSHRVHLPPSAHSTLVARDFVICTFLPRPLEKDADALRVPFYHQNMDYDEILFYHNGDFFSRDNLHAGMLSYHPMGFPHGPHPKAMQTVKGKTETNEYAVMIDSRWPLKRDVNLEAVELKDYWKSWKS